MLSYNFGLWYKTNKQHLSKKNLVQICGIMFLDIYALSFILGYSIYFKNILIPDMEIYKFRCLIAFILIFCQIIKVFGFFYCFTRKNFKFKHPAFSIVSIGILYLMMSLMPGFYVIGHYLLLMYILILTIKAFFIGYDIALVLRFTNLNFKPEDCRTIFIFIALVYDLGILASLFATRLVINGDISFHLLNDFTRLQGGLMFCFSLFIAYTRKNISSKILYFNSYSRIYFIHNLHKNWKKIITRSLIISYHVFLIYVVTFRVPGILHFMFNYSAKEINNTLLMITILGFLGANTVRLVANFVKPLNILYGLFVLSIIEGLFISIGGAIFNTFYYMASLFFTAFAYGAFLRATPMVLFPLSDFTPRNQLMNRFISYMLAYAIWSMLAIFILDFAHYINHTFFDNSSARLTIFYASICLISLYSYIKNHR